MRPRGAEKDGKNKPQMNANDTEGRKKDLVFSRFAVIGL